MNLYETPYLQCPNLIQDKNGHYGIKNLNLLKDFIDFQCFNIEKINLNNKDIIQKLEILWFINEYKNIKPLSLFYKEGLINVTNIQFLIQDMVRIIKNLESKGKTLVSINLNDIIVIDERFFIFINEFKVCNMCAEPNHALTYMPIPTSNYISPEILSNKLILPLMFHYKSCYWSLGALALDLLFEYKIDKNYDWSKLRNKIKSIKFTPIYNFLLRCLEKELNNRSLIII